MTPPAKGPVGLTSGEGANRNDESEPSCSPCGYSPTGEALGWCEEAVADSGSDLMEATLSAANVGEAWKRVKANRGSAGVDGVTVDEFPALFRERWPQLREELANGTYVPSPVRRVEIAKPGGGVRLLGIPTVLDRAIQQSIAQIVGPVFDPTFSESSFGFRPRRSAHQAVRSVSSLIKSGRRVAVDLDLSKWPSACRLFVPRNFDRVDHDVLMTRVSRRVRCKGALRLIGSYLRAGVMIEGRLQRTGEGVPQGGPLSPPLANIVLDDLDKELERRGHRFARYADDFVVMVKSVRAGERVLQSLGRFL